MQHSSVVLFACLVGGAFAVPVTPVIEEGPLSGQALRDFLAWPAMEGTPNEIFPHWIGKVCVRVCVVWRQWAQWSKEKGDC